VDQLQEIKDRLDIVEVISQYIPLKKAGANYRARCPFHDEKTPSFMVSPSKQIFHCFGCGKGGDIFGFVKDMEKIDFKEALGILAEKAGVQLQNISPEKQSLKKRLLAAHDVANDFFQQNLEENLDALAYLKERGLIKKVIHQFQLGYAPESFEKTTLFLRKQGFTDEEILKSGLAAQSEKKRGGIYDRFRNRIMFPIQDIQGKTIAFSGRGLGQSEPKYLNSPETPIYQKSHTLFNLNGAKKAIQEADRVIVVEGQMDAVSSVRAGAENTVATLGTALTEAHIQLLNRFTQNIAFAFDSDSAGQKALKRACQIALAKEMNIEVIAIIDGKDPDDCVQKDPNLWLEITKKGVDYLDFLLASLLKQYQTENSRDLAKFIKELQDYYQYLVSEAAKENFIQKASKASGISLAALKKDLKNVRSADQEAAKNILYPPSFKAEDYLLGLLWEHFSALSEKIKDLDPQAFHQDEAKKVVEKLRDCYNNSTTFQQVSALLTSPENTFLQQRALVASHEFADDNIQKISKTFGQLLVRLQDEYKNQLKRRLIERIRRAQREGKKTEVTSLKQELNQLL